MASDLTFVHGRAQRALRTLVGRAAATVWNALGSYDQRDEPRLMEQLLPLVLGAQTNAAGLVEAYLARFLGVPIVGIPTATVTGAAVRNGTPMEDVYRRALVQVWSALGDGTPWQDAVAQGAARVSSSAETDVALAMRATYGVAQDYYPSIYGYRRHPNAGACDYCLKISGAYVKSAFAMPLHNHCSCTLEPLTSPHPRARWLPSGDEVTKDYAVRQHGEMGSVLVDPGDHFTPA